MQMHTVLIIEPDQKWQKIYRCQLASKEYSLRIADSCDTALQIIHSESIDILVLDLICPDGCELANLLFILADRHDFKVIIHSDYPELKHDFRSWAADAFISRTFDLTELKCTLECWLQTNHHAEPIGSPVY
jgi:DNA-binding NtrC family response regulator